MNIKLEDGRVIITDTLERAAQLYPETTVIGEASADEFQRASKTGSWKSE